MCDQIMIKNVKRLIFWNGADFTCTSGAAVSIDLWQRTMQSIYMRRSVPCIYIYAQENSVVGYQMEWIKWTKGKQNKTKNGLLVPTTE